MSYSSVNKSFWVEKLLLYLQTAEINAQFHKIDPLSRFTLTKKYWWIVFFFQVQNKNDFFSFFRISIKSIIFCHLKQQKVEKNAEKYVCTFKWSTMHEMKKKLTNI